MPLLHKQPFIPKGIPENLGDNDKVFFCKLTKEMFTDFDEFCERIILCNSLVWSCSLTGRSNLTYQEASSCEERTKRLLKKFPQELRVPVLYLASLCERSSLVELTEDVYCYVKDRYFIGEIVSLSNSEDMEINCKILSVTPPTEDELKAYPDTDQDKDGERTYWPPGSSYKYEIEIEETGEKKTVAGDQLFRKKSLYNKDKNRLYIKQFVTQSDKFWRLKNAVNARFKISEVQFNKIFCGDPPNLSPKPKKQRTPKQKQETINKYFKASPIGVRKPISPRKSGSPRKGESKLSQLKQKRRRRTKEEMAEARRVSSTMQEAKQKAKAEKKEERLRQAMFLKEWNRKREDLECEDLRELPTPTPINCKIPQEHLGDVLFSLEFFFIFKKIIPVKDFFPFGINLEIMERALTESEIAGPFCDLLQLLLVSIFELLDQEADEIKETDIKLNPNSIANLNRGSDIKEVRSSVDMATTAAVWLRQHHGGMNLPQLTLDSSTLSEVLRLHLLTSGARPTDRTAKWRYQARGGYFGHDDPGVMLKLTHPHIIPHLSTNSVCELTIGDRVAIISCLLHQILTYSALRDSIEENSDRARQYSIEIRALTRADIKKEKELKKRKKEGTVVKEPEEVVVESSRHLRGKEPVLSRDQLHKELSKALAASSMGPLGKDRAFRRFWFFSAVPGLYVEHYEQNPGPCLPKGTPVWTGEELTDKTVKSMRLLFENGGANKENLSGYLSYPYHNHHFSPSKKLLTENNGADSPLPSRSAKAEGVSRLTCWGDEKVCPVHGDSMPAQRWSFYKDESDVERLIEALSRRGDRERHLRSALIREKENIVKALSNTPDYWFPSSDSEESETKNNALQLKVAKLYENCNMAFPDNTPHDSILESLLRDLILETEAKIHGGGLGTLRVKNREVWRSAIQSGGYEKQCKKLTWAGCSDEKKIDVVKKEDTPSEDGSRKDGDSESRCSTPTRDVNMPVTLDVDMEESKIRPVIQDLSSAILQLEQCIEYNFLKKPLGVDKKEREKHKGKYETIVPTPTLERWEYALMNSTSFPQLFLHLSTLDNSIEWERSALNACCRICRKKGDPEKMLLCDTCNKGHHLYCLKPVLSKIPSGDWHCPYCVRQNVKTSVSPLKKKRRIFFEESGGEDDHEEEEESGGECKTCGNSGSELECASCEVEYHLVCVVPPVRKVPSSKWFCHACRLANSTEKAAPVKKEKPSRPSTPEVEERLGMASEDEERTEEEEAGERCRTARPVPTRPGPTRLVPRARTQRPSPPAPPDPLGDRLSRRKSSKAASARIHKFAKQLRSAAPWEQNDEEDEDMEDGEEQPVRNVTRRRASSRRTLENHDSALPLDNAALQEILDTIMHDKDAWPFLRPVTKHEVPDYHLVIKKPMDFGTIKHKLNMLEYTKNSELIADAHLLFRNCYEYNEEGSEVYKAGEKLERMFNKLCEDSNLMSGENGYAEPRTKRMRLN